MTDPAVRLERVNLAAVRAALERDAHATGPHRPRAVGRAGSSWLVACECGDLFEATELHRAEDSYRDHLAAVVALEAIG